MLESKLVDVIVTLVPCGTLFLAKPHIDISKNPKNLGLQYDMFQMCKVYI